MDIGTTTTTVVIEPIEEPVPNRESSPAPPDVEIGVEEEEVAVERDEELVPA